MNENQLEQHILDASTFMLKFTCEKVTGPNARQLNFQENMLETQFASLMVQPNVVSGSFSHKWFVKKE